MEGHVAWYAAHIITDLIICNYQLETQYCNYADCSTKYTINDEYEAKIHLQCKLCN